MIGIGTNWNVSFEPMYHSGADLDLDFTDEKRSYPGLTCTRAGTATRRNSTGLIETVPANTLRSDYDTSAPTQENLLLWSEAFGQAAWDRSGETGSALAAESVTAPDGSMTADAYTTPSATTSFACLPQLISGQNAAFAWTFSVWLKVVSGSGSISLSISDFLSATLSSAPLSLTTTWQRFTFTVTAGQLSSTGYIGVGLNGGTAGQTYHLWGAQLNRGSTALPYLKTTAAPQRVYPCALLVEEARTNLLTYSEQSDNDAWGGALQSVVANTTEAPSGAYTADKWTATAGSGEKYARQLFTAEIATYTASIYAKAGTAPWLALSFGAGATADGAFFNLTNGTTGDVATGTTASMTEVGGGWYRCAITRALTGGTYALRHEIHTANNQLVTWVANGTEDYRVWGAQVEKGAFATSYIPTTSAAVTRNADVISQSVVSVVNQSAGTLYGEVSGANHTSDQNAIAQLDNGSTTGNRFLAYFNSSTSARAITEPSLGGPAQHSATLANKNKFVLAYDGAQLASCLNGGAVNTAAYSPAPSTLTRLLVGSINGVGALNGRVHRIAYWRRRLTNTELQQYTA